MATRLLKWFNPDSQVPPVVLIVARYPSRSCEVSASWLRPMWVRRSRSGRSYSRTGNGAQVEQVGANSRPDRCEGSYQLFVGEMAC